MIKFKFEQIINKYEGERIMITISLDEYGNFETEENRPLFVAGLIFDDQDQQGSMQGEARRERERITAYYNKVMQEAGEGVSYPKDLHSNGDIERDHKVIGPVKSKIAETLPEFIKNGTYAGKSLINESGKKISARKGKYHLFIMLKSDDGKKRLLSNNANMLANDDWAANRYFHMASSVVNRIIFHNPLYAPGHMPKISIDIATRSTGNLNDLDGNLVAEFKKQAYRVNQIDNSNYKFYSIMNADIYRTLIAQEMINSGNISVNIDSLYVKSIQYDPTKQMMEFLYLSDSICSILGYKLMGDSADDWLSQIVKKIEIINPDNDNLVFGYDEIDNSFSKAWNYYECKDLFEALSITYDAKLKKGKFAEYYRDTWFPYLEKRVRETVTPEYFNKCINELSALLTINNLKQEKLLYLMQQFELMVEKVSDKYRSIDMKSATLYKLYDAGVSAFCHIRNATKALEYYEKCKEFAFYVGVDAYLNTNNKLVVCLEDAFEWDKGLEIAKEDISNQQLASEMKREILKNGDESDFLDEAITISQYARILAEKRDPTAEKFFKEALGKLEKGSANYKITQSYLLHFYADMNMKKEYDEEVSDYFDGKTTFKQRLRYITRVDEAAHSVFSNEYALYVLVRGLFYFHQDEIDDTLWNKLCELDVLLTQKDGKEPSGHPWEITYKYLEMLAIKRKDDNARKLFAKLKRERLNYRGEIIVALEMFGDAEVANCENNIARRDALTNDLVSYLKNNFRILKERAFSSNGDERYQELQNYFTFMYR